MKKQMFISTLTGYVNSTTISRMGIQFCINAINMKLRGLFFGYVFLAFFLCMKNHPEMLGVLELSPSSLYN